MVMSRGFRACDPFGAYDSLQIMGRVMQEDESGRVRVKGGTPK